MVTFQDILLAFGKYKVDKSKESWDALWIKSNTIMAAFLTKELCKKGVCKDDREAIITDAVSNIMAMFKQAHFADIAWVESRFHLQKKAALKANTWATKKDSVVFSMDDSTAPIVNILQKPCQPCDF